MRLHEWNVFSDIPAQFIERYDIVHVRLLGLVITSDTHKTVLHNLQKMLSKELVIQYVLC